MSAVYQQLETCVRPMNESDLDRVLAIEQLAYDFPWSRTIFNDCLRVGYCCWVLVNQMEEIDAYGIMSVAAGECHILNLCVHSRVQGMGNGHRLLDCLLSIARQHHADTAFLEVRPSNDIARQLYLNAGFNEVGMRREYYPARNGREDAIIMARSLAEE